MKTFDFFTYLSTFTWRYGSEEMRRIYSEQHKYELWRKIWVALAEVQHKAGLITKEELNDLKKHEKDINIERIIEIEKETHHDVVAAIREFAEKAKVGGKKIHLGATSMDVDDNEDIIRINEALSIVEQKLIQLLKIFSQQIKTYINLPCIGYTHLQAAEPTTVGYRLAFYAQDLLIDFETLQFVKKIICGKGFKGAVGTSASYISLLKNSKLSAEDLDQMVSKSLGFKPALITSQIYTRKFEFFVLSFLQSLTSSLAKFAGDLRILQSANFSEWSEPFGKKQVGSSAMPFKKNPLNSEKICSLARYVNHLSSIALENASLSYLERTLDDSANRRIIIAESFLATDEILKTANRIISGLTINKPRIEYNLNQYGPFAATELILIEMVRRGTDRQKSHELLREISMKAWQEMQQGKTNPMKELLLNNSEVNKYLSKQVVEKLLDVKNHIGNAPQRALKLVNKLMKLFSLHP